MTLLDKAFSVLEIFLCFDDYEIRLSELAKMSGLHIATVSRIVSKLVDYGYLSQAETRGKYMLGTKFLEFSVIIEKSNIIRRLARPFLLKIYKKTDETVGIFKWDGNELILIDEIRSTSIPRISTNSYENLPFYCTAIGKLVLARMTYLELETYLSGIKLEAHTKNTITDIDDLREYISKMGVEGIAYDNEECLPGVSNVAASIGNIQGKTIACLSVVGPSSRLTMEKMKEIAPYLKECAVELSDKLGYSGEFK